MRTPLYVNNFGKLVGMRECRGLEIRFDEDKLKVSSFDSLEITYNSLVDHNDVIRFSFNSKFINANRGW